jgi:antitoxin component YwqK of YwqJK toxin-antitoxin module
MKKLIIFLSLLVGFTISVNASENKTYSEQDVHYDKTSFLMFDKNNSPVSGVIKVFFDDQKIHKEIPYVSGKKHGVETWYWPNGNKRFSVHWENAVRNGSLEEFRQDGTQRLMHTYANGQREGKQITYHFNGHEKKVFYIYDGKESNEERLYQTGQRAHELKSVNHKVEERTYYRNGKLKYLGTLDRLDKIRTVTLYYRNGQLALEMTKTKDSIEGYIYSLSGKKTKLTKDKSAALDLFLAYGFFKHQDTEKGWDEITMEFYRELL